MSVFIKKNSFLRLDLEDFFDYMDGPKERKVKFSLYKLS